jgi:Helix-turn-helix.
MPIERCPKFNAFISKVFGFVFRSDRGACIRRIREIGVENFAKEMTESGNYNRPVKKALARKRTSLHIIYKKDTRKGAVLKMIVIFVPEKVSNMENLPLNEYVKAKRKALGFSREEFAQKAGVGLRFLRELEQGKETLKMDKVNQVLKLFGVQLGVVPMDRNNLI